MTRTLSTRGEKKRKEEKKFLGQGTQQIYPSVPSDDHHVIYICHKATIRMLVGEMATASARECRVRGRRYLEETSRDSYSLSKPSDEKNKRGEKKKGKKTKMVKSLA